MEQWHTQEVLELPRVKAAPKNKGIASFQVTGNEGREQVSQVTDKDSNPSTEEGADSETDSNPYMEKRAANIARNTERLISLGLSPNRASENSLTKQSSLAMSSPVKRRGNKKDGKHMTVIRRSPRTLARTLQIQFHHSPQRSPGTPSQLSQIQLRKSPRLVVNSIKARTETSPPLHSNAPLPIRRSPRSFPKFRCPSRTLAK
jgi:hypothetical protein